MKGLQKITESWTDAEWTEFKQALKFTLQVAESRTITFVKADGTERVMRCTLNENHLPAVITKPSSEDTKPKRNRSQSLYLLLINVFDLDKQDWRSIKLKSIIDIR